MTATHWMLIAFAVNLVVAFIATYQFGYARGRCDEIREREGNEKD